MGDQHKRELKMGINNRHSNEIDSKDIAMLASWGACCVTRDSSKRAFEKYGRAMLTSQMIEEIGAAYAKFAENK